LKLIHRRNIVSLVFWCLPTHVAVAVAMPAPIHPFVRTAIHNELELGFDNDTILAGHDISLRSLQRMRGLWIEYGVVHVTSDIPRGRPRKLSILHVEELLEYLDERPMAYLDELVYYLFDEFDLLVDESTVWLALHRIGWSRKTLRRTIAQRNQLLRNHWFSKLSRWRPD